MQKCSCNINRVKLNFTAFIVVIEIFNQERAFGTIIAKHKTSKSNIDFRCKERGCHAIGQMLLGWHCHVRLISVQLFVDVDEVPYGDMPCCILVRQSAYVTQSEFGTCVCGRMCISVVVVEVDMSHGIDEVARQSLKAMPPDVCDVMGHSGE